MSTDSSRDATTNSHDVKGKDREGRSAAMPPHEIMRKPLTACVAAVVLAACAAGERAPETHDAAESAAVRSEGQNLDLNEASVLDAAPAETPALSDIAPDSVARRMLVDVRDVDSTILVNARYAGSDNFTSALLPGYHANRALLRREAAHALARAQQELRQQGYGLKVWDGYRPVRATLAMVEWAERAGRGDLLNGWIGRRSRHNLGLAVDATLVDLDTGEPLDMGTDFDTFTRAAYTGAATGDVAWNRQRLVEALEAQGFSNYFREWWHFDYRAENPLRFDLPIR